MLTFAGILILFSAALDIMSTVLIVGLTAWAYPWLALEVLILAVKVVKVVFLEPMRETDIRRVELQRGHEDLDPDYVEIQLPLVINTVSALRCRKVCTRYNIFEELATGFEWRSTTPGLWIGQEYTTVDPDGKGLTSYLSTESQKLTLKFDKETTQANQALQREFLAALKNVTQANKVP